MGVALGGPLATASAGALLVIIGLVLRRKFVVPSLIIGIPVVVLAHNRTGLFAVVTGAVLIGCSSSGKWVSRLSLGGGLLVAALVTAFGVTSGFTGRLSLWLEFIADLRARGLDGYFCAGMASCAPLATAEGRLPFWAIDAHNSLLQVWLQFGPLMVLGYLAVATFAVFGLRRRMTGSEFLKTLALAVPSMLAASVAPILGSFDLNYLASVLLVMILYWTSIPTRPSSPHQTPMPSKSPCYNRSGG